MIDETGPLGESSAQQVALNAALAAAFPPPATPSDLRAGVLAAIARQPAVDWAARRQDLEHARRSDIADLNRRYLRRSRDAVLVGAGLVAALGFSIKPLSNGLAPLFANAAPMVAGFLALSVGVLCGAAVLRDLFNDAGRVTA